MPALHLAFQDGFANDTAVVQVNGAEAARKSGLTSSLATSFAGSHDVDVDRNVARVEVSIPGRKLKASADVDLANAPHLGVSIVGNELRLTPSREPFYYL